MCMCEKYSWGWDYLFIGSLCSRPYHIKDVCLRVSISGMLGGGRGTFMV